MSFPQRLFDDPSADPAVETTTVQAPEVVARNINSGGRNTVDGREVKMTRAFGGKKSKNVLDALNLDGAVERVDVDRDTWNTISIGDSYPQ